MNINEAYNKRFNAIKNGKPYTFDYKKAVFGTTDSEKIVNLINEPLSSALFRYMKELDVSVNQLAAMTGISASSISRYRKGRRGIKRDYLCAICIALGLFSCRQRHLFTITHNVLPDGNATLDNREYIIRDFMDGCANDERFSLAYCNRVLKANKERSLTVLLSDMEGSK